MICWARDFSAEDMAVAGHRIVHGGPKLTQPARITPEVKQEIESVAAIAPLHNQDIIVSCSHVS